MNRTYTLSLSTLALALVAGCGVAGPIDSIGAADAPPSSEGKLPELPSMSYVAKVGASAHLVRYYDDETKVLCYALDNPKSSPSCLLVTEPPKNKN